VAALHLFAKVPQPGDSKLAFLFTSLFITGAEQLILLTSPHHWYQRIKLCS